MWLVPVATTLGGLLSGLLAGGGRTQNRYWGEGLSSQRRLHSRRGATTEVTGLGDHHRLRGRGGAGGVIGQFEERLAAHQAYSKGHHEDLPEVLN
jgi:hypothetical protein